MASPDLAFCLRIIVDPTAIPRAEWKFNKNNVPLAIGLEVGLATIWSIIAVSQKNVLVGILGYALARVLLATAETIAPSFNTHQQ